MATASDKKLAMSVINAAIEDLIADPRDTESYEFLTGQTEISEFWFEIADYKPLVGPVSEVVYKIIQVQEAMA